MKRTVFLLLALCFAVLLFCSCAKEPVLPTDDTSVTTAGSTDAPETAEPIPPIEGTVILTINPDGTATEEPSNAKGWSTCDQLVRDHIFDEQYCEYLKEKGINPLTEADVEMIDKYYDFIYNSLIESVAEYEKENCLIRNRTTEYVTWVSNSSHYFMFQTECISNVTEKTTQKYGCGDHSHVFGYIAVEKKDDGSIVLTLLPPVGG